MIFGQDGEEEEERVDKTLHALFDGKQVTWEGYMHTIDLPKKFIKLRMSDCRVTRADGNSAKVLSPTLYFKNVAELENNLQQLGLQGNPVNWDAKQLNQKIRFTMTLEPEILPFDLKLPPVHWVEAEDPLIRFKGTAITLTTRRPKILGWASTVAR